MAVDPQELKTEIDTNGVFSGLAPNDILAIINDPAHPTQSGSIDVLSVEPWQLLNAVDPAEFVAMVDSVPDGAKKLEMWRSLTALESVPVKEAGIRGLVQAIWPGGSTTLGNLSTLQTRTGSRAEVLWGDGSVVTLDDVRAAISG